MSQELRPEQRFFLNLFDNAESWRKNQGDICKFSSIFNKPVKWLYNRGRGEISSAQQKKLYLDRVSLWRTPDKPEFDSVFMIGERRWRGQSALDFLFAFQKRVSVEGDCWKLLRRYFRDATYKGSGLFEFPSENSDLPADFRVDCFADQWELGGNRIGMWSARRVLTTEGLSECFKLLQVVGNTIIRPNLQEAELKYPLHS